MRKQRVGVGLHHQDIQWLQEIRGLRPRRVHRRGTGGRGQDLDGQAADDLFGPKECQGHAHEIQTGSHRDGFAQHVGRLDASRGLAQEPSGQPAGGPRPKDGRQTQTDGRPRQKVVGHQQSLAGRIRFEFQDVAGKE